MFLCCKKRSIMVFCLVFMAVFVVDQTVKLIILNGFRWNSTALSIVLVCNKGVAFSMLSWLNEWLKYMQMLLLAGVIIYIYITQLIDVYGIPFGMLIGAGSSNVLDRFMHGGVVDYIHYHYGF
ncbi:MAG: signal peptidase II, partial [Helicobacteraceae bacterium]|nr:signal peptidase II [Helicobacteraceae bacterium]